MLTSLWAVARESRLYAFESLISSVSVSAYAEGKRSVKVSVEFQILNVNVLGSDPLFSLLRLLCFSFEGCGCAYLSPYSLFYSCVRVHDRDLA